MSQCVTKASSGSHLYIVNDGHFWVFVVRDQEGSGPKGLTNVVCVVGLGDGCVVGLGDVCVIGLGDVCGEVV